MCLGNGVVLSGLDVTGEALHVGRLREGAWDRHSQKHRNHRSGGSARPGPPTRCPYRSVLLFFASLRVLRELRANRRTLRQLRGSRTHRGSREVREDREGPRSTATTGVVVRRTQVRRCDARIDHFCGASRLAKLFVAQNKADVRVMLWPRGWLRAPTSRPLPEATADHSEPVPREARAAHRTTALRTNWRPSH